MSKTHITMARASEEELDALADFVDKIEDMVRMGDSDEELGYFIIDYLHKHSGYPFSVHRIIFGYRTMFENACDPSLSYLDFKPEIKAALSAAGGTE